MPELPEVTTTVNDLKKKIVGFKIKDVWFDYKRNILNSDLLIGKKILDVKRKGKNILIYLSSDHLMLVHQKMSGHLLVGKWKLIDDKWIPAKKDKVSEDRVNNYIHFLITFSNGYMLALSDLRKFAKVLVGEEKDIEDLRELKELGIDPFDKEFTVKEFEKLIKNQKRSIKQVLMDQGIVSGIGNIYSDEILFDSGISPLRKTNTLNKNEIERIYISIKKILKLAIKERGTSVSDFRDSEGRPGNFVNFLKVYGKKKGKCVCCKGDIKTIKMGGRTAHYCPKCQK